MSDLFWFLGLHHPSFVDAVRMVIAILVGAFFAYLFGSVRWWWIKRTRLPLMWRRAREEYETEIASLKIEKESLTEKLHRAETAAYGRVVMTFDRAVNERTKAAMASRKPSNAMANRRGWVVNGL